MTNTIQPAHVIRRDGFLYDLDDGTFQLVATVPIQRGPTVRIFTNSPLNDIFWVDDPGLPVVTCHNTIRQAFSHAVRNAGWG
jgi:hypothetical protein